MLRVARETICMTEDADIQNVKSTPRTVNSGIFTVSDRLLCASKLFINNSMLRKNDAKNSIPTPSPSQYTFPVQPGATRGREGSLFLLEMDAAENGVVRQQDVAFDA